MSILRAQILSMIPHQGLMCLHDEVLEWDVQKLRLRTAGHRHPAHPLRRDGRLHAVHLGEYGAQAMAVHGGLLAQASGKNAAAGFLVSLRQLQLHCARIDDLDDDLMTFAECLQNTEVSSQYQFEIHAGARLLASGRAAVMLRSAASASIEENS